MSVEIVLSVSGISIGVRSLHLVDGAWNPRVRGWHNVKGIGGAPFREEVGEWLNDFLYRTKATELTILDVRRASGGGGTITSPSRPSSLTGETPVPLNKLRLTARDIRLINF